MDSPQTPRADLPPGWVWTTLGEIQHGERRAINPMKTPDQQFELYSVPSYDVRHPEIVSGSAIGSGKQRVEPGTVLLCKINPRINRVWVVGDFSRWPKIASTEWIPFPEQGEVLPRFLCYFLQSIGFRDFLTLNVSGVGGSLMRARSEAIEGYPFPLAPLPEQHRIVAKIEELFSELDAGVAALKRVQAALKRYRASVLKAACEGRLVPTETELAREESREYEPADVLLKRILAERRARWEAGHPGKKYVEPAAPETDGLPELPEGWCWATVEQLSADEPSSITDGPFGSNLKTEHYTSTGPRVIRLQNIGDGEFRDEQAHISQQHFDRLRRHEVFANDLVIAGLGETLPRACIIPGFVGPAIVKADCIRFRPHQMLAAVRYLNAALNSEVLKKVAVRIVHGVGRPRMNQQEIKSLSIPLPPLAEQHRIAAEVERRLSVVAEVEATVTANLARAGRLRQAVLKRAFEGRLVAQDANDVPAEALFDKICALQKNNTRSEKDVGGQERLPGSHALIFDSPRMAELSIKYATVPDSFAPHIVLLGRADSAAEHRAQLERLVARAPSEVRARWIRELLNPQDGVFFGAWFEVMMFDWLSQIDDTVPSPVVEGDHPDFLVSTTNQQIAVECKVLLASELEQQTERIIGPLMEALDEIPASFMVFVNPKHVASEVDIRKIIVAVRDWLESCAHEPLSYRDPVGNDICFTSFPMEDDASQVCSVLGQAPEEELGNPTINVSRLKRALADKAKQHRALRKAGYPYVIAILLVEPLLTSRSVVRAWFGEEQLTFRLSDGRIVDRRFDQSGIQYYSGKLVHTSVSGILVCTHHFEPATGQFSLDCQYLPNTNAAMPIDSRVFVRKL